MVAARPRCCAPCAGWPGRPRVRCGGTAPRFAVSVMNIMSGWLMSAITMGCKTNSPPTKICGWVRGCAALPGKVLSLWQRRRLALARLLVGDSLLWILDEPFNALDVNSVGRVQTLLGEHLDRGGMVVLTTHQEVEITSRRARHVHLGE